MKCTIPGSNIKVFGRAIHSLARIGEELYVEPYPTGVYFRAVNSSRSAFASFHFGSRFFAHYNDGSGGQQSAAGEEAVKCKACLNVFKSLVTLVRSVERSKLFLDGEEAKLGIQFICKYGIVKSYNLPFIECETLHAAYDKTSCTNYIKSQAQVLSKAVINFQSNQEEVTLCVSSNKIVIRTFVDDVPDPGKAIHTELTLEAGEFDSYNIPDDCEVTFCLKELRAILAFAEPINLSVASYFTEPGNPIIFAVDNHPMFESTFVLATMAPKSNTQASRNKATDKHTSKPGNGQRSSASPSCSQAASWMKTPMPSTSGLKQANSSTVRRSEQITNISNRFDESRARLSSPHNSSTRGNHNPQLGNGSARHLSTQPVTHTNNVNASQLEISLPNLDVVNKVTEEEDVIPGTPPSKRAKFFFRRCFESTFDPTTVPGHDRILASDSDDDS
ncbi:cell cycle checkpoint control protein RAD9A-like isoform X2 [Homarus americanus]|uniref:cell cycle checkpoint control protein RAD9A-like isoform X2 n=1 Tax=Homarus americanus TaxID=6706 RepID=UPI001C491372|nr:cell cycle checkpoint control protein RAD9A-like isoform X2 [Homarus americanus]